LNLRIWLMIAGLLVAPAAAWSQPAAALPEGAPENVEFDPIRCWWRTSTGAVRVGETFTLVLTCAVLDNEGAQVVVDDSKLAPSVMQLVPFEVVDGARPADLRERQRRFFQYEYVLRAINPDLIGQDVPLPNLVIPYRINSRIPGNASQEGRELSYLLPPMFLRVVSTVPDDAEDIRDTPDVTFSSIEALRSRAGLMDLVALIFTGLGSVMVLLAVAGLFTGRRKRERKGPREVPPHTIAGLAARELEAVRQEAGSGGWSQPLVDRALSATRIAAASALGRKVSQRTMSDAGPGGEGRLLHRRLLPPGGWVAVSAATTAEDVTRAVEALNPAASPAARAGLEQLRDALSTLTAAHYGRSTEFDRTALDQAVEAAAAQAKNVRTQRLKPAALVRAWRTRRPGVDKAA
jgi:hypothetical protein